LKLACLLLALIVAPMTHAQGGIVTVGVFLSECARDREPCLAFVLGVIEGARHQTRERLQAQPYAFLLHGEPVCLPVRWSSEDLTSRVLEVLQNEPATHRFSAVSGVLYALAAHSECQQT
jgi:hypothetical protein